jgi:hypothetical protein
VTLSATVYPSGLVVSFNPSAVSLLAGGSASSVMTFSAPSGTPTGTYIVAVTAANVGISQTFSVGVTVEPPGWRFALAQFLAQPGSYSILAGLAGLVGIMTSSGLIVFRVRSTRNQSHDRVVGDLWAAKENLRVGFLPALNLNPRQPAPREAWASLGYTAKS